MKQRLLLTLLVATLTAGLAVGSTALARPGDPTPQTQEQTKKKKKPRKGKKVVKATVVDPEPAPGEEEPAAAEESTASEPGAEASAEPSSKEVKKSLKAADRAAAKEAKEAERERDRAAKEAERRARAEAKEAERAGREADKRRRAEAEAARKEQLRTERELAAAERSAQRAEKVSAKAEQKAAKATAAPQPVAASPVAETEPVVAEPAPAAETIAEPAPSPAPSRIAADVPAERPQFREQIEVREVQLDVLVTDRDGNVVQGLGPEDFVVEENGVRQEITSVIFYGGIPELRGSGVAGEQRTDRYFILFFHDQAQSSPALTGAQLDAGRWARRWVEEELQPNDQVAVLGYDVKLKVYEDFTRDKTKLVQAITNAAIGKKAPDRWRTEEERTATVDSPSLLVNLPTGKTLARQTRKVQQALALVGRAAEGIVGRKNLIMFSLGFGDILDFGEYTPDPRYYPEMMQSLNTGNVAVYTIDLIGAVRGVNATPRNINDSLSLISTDTGGHYYSIFTNVSTPLRQVASDNLGYYLISYRSDFERGTTGYREVDVKTTNKQWKVRAREGYRYGGDS